MYYGETKIVLAEPGLPYRSPGESYRAEVEGRGELVRPGESLTVRDGGKQSSYNHCIQGWLVL